MRSVVNAERIRRFIEELGRRATGPGRVYLTGGSTAVLFGWRNTTVDVDLKLDPEPPGIFDAIHHLKDELDINVELAAPDQFIPPTPGWQARSLSIGTFGQVEFLHYDLIGQALSKIERGHARDVADVHAMIDRRLLEPGALERAFGDIRAELPRYPAVDERAFAQKVRVFVESLSERSVPCSVSDIDDLPGADLIQRGLDDVAAGNETVEALLVEIAAPRLRQLGLRVPDAFSGGDAEIRLYARLGQNGALDPYGAYNALLRRLSSFVRALEHRRSAPRPSP